MKTFLLLCAICIATPAAFGQKKQNDPFVCLPCGHACDTEEYTEGGQCTHCNMELVRKSTIKHTSVSPNKICKFIAGNSNLVLLDVRTKEEFEGSTDPNFGTLKNAINIPINELSNRLSELNTHRGKTILVFCSHSHRSPRASYLLTQNGFRNVVNMEGGMSVMTDEACKK